MIDILLLGRQHGTATEEALEKALDLRCSMLRSSANYAKRRPSCEAPAGRIR